MSLRPLRFVPALIGLLLAGACMQARPSPTAPSAPAPATASGAQAASAGSALALIHGALIDGSGAPAVRDAVDGDPLAGLDALQCVRLVIKGGTIIRSDR